MVPNESALTTFVPHEWDVDTEVVSTNIAAEEWDEFQSAVTYEYDSVVTEGETVWRAAYGSVSPTDPESTDPDLVNQGHTPSLGHIIPTGYEHAGSLWWVDVTNNAFLENRYRMLGPNLSDFSSNSWSIEIVLAPSSNWNCLALFGVSADRIQAEITDGPSAWSKDIDLRYETIISEEFPNKSTIAFTDIPTIYPELHPDAQLSVTLTVNKDSRQVQCSYLAVGYGGEIGLTLYGTEIGIVDYSRKDRSIFGDIVIIERGYTETVKYKFDLPTDDAAQIRQHLANLRATAAVYIGAPNVPETICYGFYNDFTIPLEGFSFSEGELTVESLVLDSPLDYNQTPDSVVFIDRNGTACIESHKGATLQLCTTSGTVTEKAVATTLDVTVGPLDTVDWSMEWIEGSSTIDPLVSELETSCGQVLPILVWPPSVPVSHGDGIAVIRLTYTPYEGTPVELEPATLVVGGCGDSTCNTDVSSHGFYANDYNPDYDPLDPVGSEYAYSVTSETHAATLEAEEIPEATDPYSYPEFLAIVGCAGQEKYYWCDVVCPQYAYWTLTLAGDAAENICLYVTPSEDGELTPESIPTPTLYSETLCGAGSLAHSTGLTHTVRLLVLAVFSGTVSEEDGVTINVTKVCGVSG